MDTESRSRDGTHPDRICIVWNVETPLVASDSSLESKPQGMPLGQREQRVDLQAALGVEGVELEPGVLVGGGDPGVSDLVSYTRRP